MTFQEWFNSAPHRAKYSNDHPAYLAAQEAWEAAHEACAKVLVDMFFPEDSDYHYIPDARGALKEAHIAIRARGMK